jgi:hypothetical protein
MPAGVSAPSSKPALPAYGAPPSAAIFRYEGQESLTVIGPVTGRKYWFERNGAELAVDLRDRIAVTRVPNVRQVRVV